MPDERPLTRTEMVALLVDFKRELKQELKQELGQELRQDLKELKHEIFGRIDAAERRGRMHTERIETRVLTAFPHWSTPTIAFASSRMKTIASLNALPLWNKG